MPARDGEITARRAALLLSVHVRTVRRWVANAADGHPTTLRHGRVDSTGHYWVQKAEVVALLEVERRN